MGKAIKWSTAGVLLASLGIASAEIRYVDVKSTNASPPYTNWGIAAATIQDAVDAAAASDEIVVASGLYATGWRTLDGSATNRVAVDKPLTIRSVNGPQFTIIDGAGSVRCVSLTNGSTLTGFTLTNGLGNGGGAAVGGELNRCTLCGNSAFGTDGFSGFGGGALDVTLNDCTLTHNSADEGGGAYRCALNNCTLSGNSAIDGGGANYSILNNCTLTGNAATFAGGGASDCSLNNCLIVFNSAAQGPNYDSSSSVNYCCTTPLPLGSPGNIASDPLFTDTNGWANLRLQTGSPCINAGNNAFAPAGLDLDGNPRIVGGSVDIGAYEYQSPVSQISYAWLQNYGLLINASTDTADPDGDAVDNYHEWLAGTNPTNALSSPAQLSITPFDVPPGGILLTWSTNAVGFTLQSTANLLSPIWTTNSPASAIVNGLNTLKIPNSGTAQFYRLSH